MENGYSQNVQDLITLLTGKWAILTVHTLQESTLRFNELQRELPQATQKVLTETLRRLERNGIITRTPYPTIPPQVEYKLTPIGLELLPITQVVIEWSENHFNEIKRAQKAYDKRLND